MPADRPDIHQGYLRSVLVNGTKPFRYRSGIRTLLGVSEDPDTQIAFPLALPPVGFNYLQQRSFNAVGMESYPAFSETSLLESENAEFPGRAPFQRPRAAEAKTDNRDANPVGAPAKPLAFSDTRKAAVSHSDETHKTLLADRKSGQQEADDASAGNDQIDIPGFSEKQLRFAALAPRETPQTPGSESPLQIAGVQQPRPPRSAAKTATDDDSVNKSGATHEAPGPLRLPSRKPEIFKPADPISVHPISEFKAAKRKAAVDERAAEDAGPFRNNRPLTTNPNQARSLPIQSSQHAAEAQIEQLRQSLRTLRRKAVSRESELQESQNSPQTESIARNRPATADPQPVVIVHRSNAHRREPSAFWERSYLGHFLRMRRLR